MQVLWVQMKSLNHEMFRWNVKLVRYFSTDEVLRWEHEGLSAHRDGWSGEKNKRGDCVPLGTSGDMRQFDLYPYFYISGE